MRNESAIRTVSRQPSRSKISLKSPRASIDKFIPLATRDLSPKTAINKFYDKNMGKAHDRFYGQNKHLAALEKAKADIRAMKRGKMNETVMIPNVTELPVIVKYPLDGK